MSEPRCPYCGRIVLEFVHIDCIRPALNPPRPNWNPFETCGTGYGKLHADGCPCADCLRRRNNQNAFGPGGPKE